MVKLPLQHTSLNEMAYEVIKEKIVNGELPAGSRLQEDFLVNMLGASKTPIKLALTKLEQNGLVSTIPRRGTYVIKLTAEIAREIYSLREMLEGLAARLAAQNISAKDISRIRNIVSKMKVNSENTPLDSRGLKSYLEIDEKFHDVILKASSHHLLQESLKPLFDMITMSKSKAVMVTGRLKKAYEEHLIIFEAINKRDSEKAEKSMRYHIQRVMKDILENFPDGS